MNIFARFKLWSDLNKVGPGSVVIATSSVTEEDQEITIYDTFRVNDERFFVVKIGDKNFQSPFTRIKKVLVAKKLSHPPLA